MKGLVDRPNREKVSMKRESQVDPLELELLIEAGGGARGCYLGKYGWPCCHIRQTSLRAFADLSC